MRFGGTYRFDHKGTATLQPAIKMLDGTVEDYGAAGIASDKLFNAQELVAQFGGKAGFAANLPLIGGIRPPELALEKKLTDYLTGSFTGGQVQPPVPGQANPPSMNFVIEQVDLLNNYANFGFIAAKIHPSIKITLTSSDMGITVAKKPLSFAATPNPTMDLPMDAAQISSFRVEKPNYDIDVTLKPGLTARMSLNLAVWSASVDWPVDLPIAGLKLSTDFGCHDGTICERDYILSPDGPYSPFKRDVENWGLNYDKYWQSKCFDVICADSIKWKRHDTVEWAWDQEDVLGSNARIDKSPVVEKLVEAKKAAEKYYADSLDRKAQKSSDTSDAMGTLAQALYTSQCQDSICVDKIANLAAQMGPAAKQAAYANPTMDTAAINKLVNKQFAPKFAAEVEASKLRANMKLVEQAKKAGKQPKFPKPN